MQTFSKQISNLYVDLHVINPGDQKPH